MALLPTRDLRRAVVEIEAMGFGTIWIGEALAREPFAACAIILEATSHIKVATGIANIWARDPTAMMNGGRGMFSSPVTVTRNRWVTTQRTRRCRNR